MLDQIAQYWNIFLILAGQTIDFLKHYNIHHGAMLAALTYALTYIVKLTYIVLVKLKYLAMLADDLFDYLTQAFAIASGLTAAFIGWPETSPMAWYVAGILAGPGAILAHIVMMKTLGARWPWFGAVLRCYRKFDE